MMSRAKHSVKVLKRDVDRKCVELEFDGEKVRVERFSKEEDKEWTEHLKSGKFNILSVRAGYIDFDHGPIEPFDEETCKRAWRKIYRRKALAVYRLLWYFGPPYHIAAGDISSCEYLVKYKGFVFSIEDALGNYLKIDSLHLVTREEFLEASRRGWEKEKEYAPPDKIKEEILSIIEHLTKKPVKIRTDAGPLFI